ncbi:MAG: 4Fe-4S binding protein [Calditrichaeota bacterium]|nr:4Fe-4S binding protein [Calditrichota bacterium]
MEKESQSDAREKKDGGKITKRGLRGRLDALDGQKLRLSVQIIFMLATLYTGWRFVEFVHYLRFGGTPVTRPPGVEAFLPLSSLISLKYWILTGIYNSIHPAGLAIFIAILLMGILLKRSFCTWVCPIGFLSEYLWKTGRKLFGRNVMLPKILDYPLRSIKYLLLIFFAWGILVKMSVFVLRSFIYSPYNKIADIKMLMFFEHLSSFSFWVLVGLVVLSIPIKNFWCRYLCPYGALLGFLSLFSPVRITRNPETCIDCGLCTEACPANIQVHRLKRVRSDECTTCLRCTAVCPVENTLDLRLPAKRKPIRPWVYALAIVLTFVVVTGLARLTGHWKNKISTQEYRARLQEINQPIYNHTGE